MNDLLCLNFFYKTTELNNSLAFVNIIFQNFLLFIVVYFVVLFPNSTCGIFWVRGHSQPRDQTQVSRIAGRFLTVWAITEAHTHACSYV